MMNPENSLHILLVEDDEIDAEIVRRAFHQEQMHHPLIWVSDGVDALNALRGEGGQRRVPRPYLIFLDINMPRMNGIEFIQTLRQDPDLKGSIVFVLTTSVRLADRVAAYEQQVAGYFLKSKMGEGFLDIINLIRVYQQSVEFPPCEHC
jgi:CheY-like chemotaxis protein